MLPPLVNGYNPRAVRITGGTIDGVVIGGTTAGAGAFTTLSASSTVSGAGFTAFMASPPAIGGTTPAAINGTDVSATQGFYGGYGQLTAPEASGIALDLKARSSDGICAVRFTDNAFSAAQGTILSFSTGDIFMSTGTSPVNFGFRLAHTASAVNYLQFTSAVTGSSPILTSVGTDTNIDLILSGQGAGVIRFGNTSTAAAVPANFSAARYLPIKDGSGTTYYIPLDTATW